MTGDDRDRLLIAALALAAEAHTLAKEALALSHEALDLLRMVQEGGHIQRQRRI
jgi:hypothetical protein